MLDDNKTFIVFMVAGYFVASALGGLIADVYWQLWGRDRFNRQLSEAIVAAEIAAPEGHCTWCERPFRLTRGGNVWHHGKPRTFPPVRCTGAGKRPKGQP